MRGAVLQLLLAGLLVVPLALAARLLRRRSGAVQPLGGAGEAFHRGIDLAARRGTDVVAPAAGTESRWTRRR